MGENHISIVVLRIRPKFWWMQPMGVRDNHTKYEPKTQRWRPGTGVASAGPLFQNLQFRAKISLFCPNSPKNLLKMAKRREIVAALHMQLDFPVPKGPLGPSNSTICPRIALKMPPKAPKFVHIGRRQNAISSAPNPPTTTHFWWFPPLKIALTNA